MLGGEHPAGAAEAGGDLVQDQQRPMTAAKVVNAAHERGLRHECAEVTDHWLEDHGRDVDRLERSPPGPAALRPGAT